MQRIAERKRTTRETQITIRLDLDGSGTTSIHTGIGFLDHMLELLGKHALFDLTIEAAGDLHVDYHHTVEDVGLTLGETLNEALGQRIGIQRYGWCLLPMDETLSRIAIDLGGRPYLVYQIANRKRKIGDFDLDLLHEFFQAFTIQARMNLHIAHLYGKDAHHAYESIFKGLARALRAACQPDPRAAHAIPSSKGIL